MYAINLDPRVWRRGLGRLLLDSAAAELRALGFHSAVLWVIPDNARARAMYESAGWAADGASSEDELFGVVVSNVRYRRSLEW